MAWDGVIKMRAIFGPVFRCDGQMVKTIGHDVVIEEKGAIDSMGILTFYKKNFKATALPCP